MNAISCLRVEDEKEEGEISLEDVSSSDEGHLNCGYGIRTAQCSNCLSTQHNAAWCTSVKPYHSKGSNRREVDLILQDAVQGKENRHQIKESGCNGTKHTTSTLQEKNDDLVPISSDSDMEIVGLADNSKQIIIRSSAKTKVKKKKKRKRTHASLLVMDDLVSTSTIDVAVPESLVPLKHDNAKSTSRTHHREISPVHRSNRSRAALRSPPRKHRSLARPHSPFRRSKSPLIRARSPMIRRSPRRVKSPKRSPYRSPGKSMPRKTSHVEAVSSHNYVDTHKLLKKVRHLDSIGTHSLEETLNKNKEHASSLKEKLTNMMKKVCDNNNETTNVSKEKSITQINKKEPNDADDDEDLALLRQKALETKQKKSTKQNDQPKTDTDKKLNAPIDDDQDEEDLELRMIALRSAVLKKHQNRVQKSLKTGKYKKSTTSRSESPFTQSFLDSIPIPGEELLSFASPPHTPLPMSENNHTEDMELDTDVEREKEKLPYSPTDKITADIPMDTELLCMQPSDVSFISVNETNNSPSFNTSMISSQDDQKSYQGKIIENQSYLPNIVYCAPQSTLYATNANIQYTSTDPTKIPRPEFIKVHNSNVNSYQYENMPNILKNNNTSNITDINSSQEMPYSPTDTPIYDPDLSHALPQSLGPINTSNSPLVSVGSCNFNTQENNEQCNDIPLTQQTQTTTQVNSAKEDENSDKLETLSMVPAVGSATTSIRESVSSSSSMITIDDLPEIDADANPLVDTLKNIKTESIPSKLTDNATEAISEPLYMKGIPDVTKDVNKIPTLINRTLVPAPILKTNKQLQQPLPVRKTTTQPEPTFKSAEMQPVDIVDDSSTKANTSFKPIKLMSFQQKSHSVLAVPTVFHDSLHEDSTNEILTNENTSPVESNDNVILVQNDKIINTESSDKTCDNVNPTQKKKKFMKKGLKRKSTDAVAKEHTATDSNKDNISEDVNKVTELVHRNDTQDHKESKKTRSNKSNQKDQISSEKNTDQRKDKTTSSNDVLKEDNNTNDRRQSLDEDEEALRAILLASLPKRTKSTNSTSNSSAATSVSTASNTNNLITANQITSKVVTSVVNTVSTTNINSTTVPPTVHANCVTENDKNQLNPEDRVSNTITQGNVPFDTIKASISVTSGRKRSVPVNKNLQKKLVKRIAIPASTKVVNNAKKYQNTMMQKKLNLQKAALYNKQKVGESKSASKLLLDNKWTANTKISLSDTQRIVINLESDTESDSESEQQRKQTASLANSLTTDKHQPVTNSRSEFEKNLDQFLRAVRKKQESMAAARPTSVSITPKKDTVLTARSENSNSSNLHTPLAVRHLPASQQEEYRRLKQQIIEREKLKLHRTVENNNLVKSKTAEISSTASSSKSSNKEPPSKENQVITGTSQDTRAQQINKENRSKTLESIKIAPILQTNNVHLDTTKTYSVDKQGSTSSNQPKLTSRTMTNLNICITNENTVNNGGNKTIGNPLQSTTPRQVFQSPTNDILTKSKVPPSLKILSTDEVNRKYVQIQVKNDTNERVVTINDKVTLNNKTVITRNENISENKDTANKDAHDHVINQFVQSVEKEIISTSSQSDNNDVIDSDASTVILTRENTERSLDTSESTIRLSQCEEDNQSSLNVSAATKSDSSFLNNSRLSVDGKGSIEKNWEAIRRDVKTELNALTNLPRQEQEKHLIETEQKLVLKRYTILDELAEMSGNLRQWHMERDLQTNLVAEVKKLREQLKIAEERLQLQRDRINSIGPKVVAAHGKINVDRQECFKLAAICTTLGSKIIGKEYKIPEAGAQLLDNRLKEVANHTRQLSRKKVPSIDIPETCDTTKLETSTTCLELSQSEDLLLGESNVNNVNTTNINEHQCSTQTNTAENSASTEIATVDLSDRNEQDKHSTPNNLPPNIGEETILEESNTEKEVSVEQLDLSSTPEATPVSKNSEDSNQEVLSENKTARHRTTSESSIENVQQKKRTVRPYESILIHFKIPRNANPNGVLCPYELMGTCNDGDCQFIHQKERQEK
ncbi:uncharacterized protein LOC143180440 isoform X2 [Calliopsis andreniformis]|uniref:uncharacterized protein LOC143180440 isoform X2 n=1 Tax=Calliopsis andreniformis TaxID=337506 RepID=UPI003FCEBCA6